MLHVDGLKSIFLGIVAVTIPIAILYGGSSNGRVQPQSSSSSKVQRLPDLEQWPVADFDESLPTEPAKRAKRQARNKKYDKSEWPILANDVADSTVRLHRVNPNLPAFPVQESRVVLIGQIASAAAYLSNDKTGVYSEFTVIVEEVLKNHLAEQLLAGSSIAVIREGGRIRFPSGRMHWYGIDGQNMPRISGRYVLFLSGETEETLTILTGYELATSKIMPLDDLNNPNKYRDADEVTFLKSLRASLTDPREALAHRPLGMGCLPSSFTLSATKARSCGMTVH